MTRVLHENQYGAEKLIVVTGFGYQKEIEYRKRVDLSLMKLHHLMNLKNIIGIVMNFHKYVNH